MKSLNELLSPRRFAALLIVVFGAVAAVADIVPPGTDAEIRDRLQPMGQLCRAGEDCGSGNAAAAAGGAAMSGEQVYNKFCFACHAVGVSGAPKLGDAVAWEPRVAKGVEALYTNSFNGINAMPPRGTCMGCSDDELKATVDYMLSQSK